MNWITISQFIFGIGTLLLIRAVWKNRKILNGYDLIGSLLTWIAMTLVLIQFIEWQDFVGFGFSFLTWLFWLFVVIFVTREKLRQRKINRIKRLEGEINAYLEGMCEQENREEKNESPT